MSVTHAKNKTSKAGGESSEFEEDHNLERNTNLLDLER